MSRNQITNWSNEIDAYKRMREFEEQTKGMSELQARLLAEQPDCSDNVSEARIKIWANEDNEDFEDFDF